MADPRPEDVPTRPANTPSVPPPPELIDTNLQLPGKFFGRYRLLKELGHGGMGIVWQAYDPHLRRIVALKQILNDDAEPEWIERFLREAQVAAHLGHPNIACVYDAGVDHGRPYYTMEYVDGVPLDLAIAERRMSEDKIVEAAKALMEALACAHAQGVVHRDLKPSNIILGMNGHAKLIDFGLARFLNGPPLTGPGHVQGTYLYMAPEQLTGQPATPASDVYSLGVVMFEMWTGLRPLDMQQRSGMQPNDPVLWPPAFERFGSIVIGALSGTPEHRPSASQLVTSLDQALSLCRGLRSAEQPLLALHPDGQCGPARADRGPYMESIWAVATSARLDGFPPESAAGEYSWDYGRLLSEYYRRMRGIVDFLGGKIVHLTGGTVVALFISDNSQDAVQNALVAATCMQQETIEFGKPQSLVTYIYGVAPTAEEAMRLSDKMVQRASTDPASFFRWDVKLSVSIHGGDILAGPVHDGETYRFVAFGDAIDLLSPLGKHCPPGAIIATDPIAGLLPECWKSVQRRRLTLTDGRQVLMHELQQRQ